MREKCEASVFTQLHLTGEVHYSPIGHMKRRLPTVLLSTWKCWRKWVRCTFLTPPDVLDEENLGSLLDTANREQRKLMIRRWRWNASTASSPCKQTDFLARKRRSGFYRSMISDWDQPVLGSLKPVTVQQTALPTLAEFTRTYQNK